jgi:putative chitinase
LRVVWPSRFPTLEAAEPFAHNPKALANKVYAGRLGNTQPGDGWMFRGRGLLQLTGRANYQRIGDRLELDLVAIPDRVILPAHSLTVAACIWQDHGCNAAADLDDIARVTQLINGGQIGLASRRAWLEKTRTLVQERLAS